MNDITAIPGCIGEVCVKRQGSPGFSNTRPRCNTKGKYPNRIVHKRVILVAVMAVLLALFILQMLSAWVGPCFYINLSHSVPLGLYRVVSPDRLETGELVVFEPTQGARFLIYERHWLPNNWPLIKYIGAKEEDTYTVRNNTFLINDKYVGPVYERDNNGKALPYIGGRYRVERNAFLPVSTHINNSFDGRYFGTVPLSAIRGKLKPIWTF